MQIKVLKNAGWIVGCKIIKAILTVIVTAITTRYLGVEKYGILSYAAGLVAFAVPIMQLGLTGTMVHEIINRPDDEGKVVGTVTGMTMLSSILCIIGVISFSMIVNAGEKETIIVCAVYSVMLFFNAFEMIRFWFHAKLMAKYSAMVMLISYVAVTLFQVLLVALKANVYLFALSYSIDYFLIAIMLLAIFKKKSKSKLSFSFSLAKEMFKVSKFYIISSLMFVVFSQTDKIMLKLMAGDFETGIYSAATTCATMVSFVFAAIIDSMRPEIFNARKESQALFEKRMIELYSVLIYFSIIVCGVIALFAPLIIKIICGAQYFDAVFVLRIVVWMNVFSYIGTAKSIWLLAESKYKYLIILNFCGAIVNVALNFVLIPMLGATGASITTIISQFATNFLIGFLIKPIRRNSILMLKGFDLKNLKSMFSNIKGNKE